MRRTWVSLASLAGLVLSASAGCYSTPIKRVKRPELVQEYRLPPDDDPRFSQPPTLPNKVMLDSVGRRRDEENSARQLQQPMTAPGGRMGGMGPMP